MTMRNLLRYRRSPDLLVFATIQPVIFVLLFTYVFGGAIQTVTDNYIDFLLPGILVQTVLFGSTNTGFGLAQDLSSGLVDRYRSLPMARSAVIAGRILADTLRNMFVVTLMIGVGYALGFRFHAGIGYALGIVATLVVFGHAFSWISAFIGVSIRDAETVQVAGFVWLFPLTFMSSAFVPVSTMPDWLQVVAQVTPRHRDGRRVAGHVARLRRRVGEPLADLRVDGRNSYSLRQPGHHPLPPPDVGFTQPSPALDGA